MRHKAPTLLRTGSTLQAWFNLISNTLYHCRYYSDQTMLILVSVGGFIALIESLGPRGIIVAFGGITNIPGRPMELDDADLVDPDLHLMSGNISVYDISTQTWYRQTATGDIPPWRYVGCSVVVSAPDRSSHSIYVFGGWSNYAEGSDGNVYVLSLPSFRWIRVNEDSGLRARHQCTLIGKNTFLVVGGIQPKGNDLQPSDTSGCDTTAMFAQGLGIFSLNNHTWATNYDPSIGAALYQVHPSISMVIGGDENGNANIQSPAGGFSVPALGDLLGAPLTPLNSTSTPDSNKEGTTKQNHNISKAAITGIVIGACVCAITIFTAGFYIWRRRPHQTSPRSPSRPTISSPIMNLRKASELTNSSAPTELSDGRGPVFELDTSAKPLPPTPTKPTEMEGELGWHPSERAAKQREQNAKTDMNDNTG